MKQKTGLLDSFDAELSRPELLHELFEQQAESNPDKIALAFEEATMTYGALDRKANQLARFLRSKGIGKETRVALLLPRSPDVYVALLAILKAGAAYVPLDPEYPPDRLAYILSDCEARVLVTVSALAVKCNGFAGGIVQLDGAMDKVGIADRGSPSRSTPELSRASLVDGAPTTSDALRLGEPRAGGSAHSHVQSATQWAEVAGQPATKLLSSETGVTWNDPCYIIYTSGSTGRPKGVLIEHRSACNLVRAEGRIFQVRPEDRVYQGFSIAFDASVEEIWLAFFAGATLVIGTQEMAHAGLALSGMLATAGVTVLSCVPTLLAMLDEDIPTVRLLIVGGEECPQKLVSRWCRPGRRMVNTYGPTEATVIATYAECAPNKPVTIGRAVPNYQIFILDPNLQPVAAGVTGELCIAGVGLARGYLGQAELTREKFVCHQFAENGEAIRLYRTGDLGRLTNEGEIEFMGRADSQVKLRGYRIELAEIESVLMEYPGVHAAAVSVREDVPGLQQLTGYLVTANDGQINSEAMRSALKSRLPPYMVPTIFERLTKLPTLPSGKVDRKALPRPAQRAAEPQTAQIPPRTEMEKKLAAVWTALFVPNPVSVRDHFFLDLGGHSLLAARMVSELRREPALRTLSMLDVYNYPTIESLAAKLEADCQTKSAAEPAQPLRQISRAAHARCGLLQLLGLYLVLGFFSLQWLAPYLTYTWMIEDEYSINESILGALGILAGLYPLMLLASILVKWTVIGRYKAGDYPLWSFYYFRWWFVNTIQSVIPVEYMAGTPLLNIYYRLMGARIGSNVHLGTDNFAMYDLLSIGDDSSIGTDACLSGYTVANGWLRIGPIKIGRDCFVGTRTVVREDACMEDGAALEDLSMLPRGATIPAGERWLGSPAKAGANSPPVAKVGERPRARPSSLRKAGFGLLHGVGLFLFPILVLAAILPGMILMNYLNYEDDYYSYLVVAPMVALSFVILLCAEIALIKWLLLGKVKPGSYSLYSFYYLRKWFVDQTMELSLDVLGPLYASVYLAPWYRLLGAKVGRRAEISTASFISPDLLSIDDEGFIADSVSLGAARVERGIVTIAGTRIGKRSFIGNSALLPPGSVIGDNCLIGCLSTLPAEAGGIAKEGTAWLGSPAFFLPQRQESTAFAAEQTFNPSQKLRLQRGFIELIRVILPSTGFIILTSLLFSVVVLIQEDIDLKTMLLLFPLLYAGCGVLAVLFVVAAKWILVGKYKPGERPLWSTFVWRNELVNALHEHLADLFLVEMLTGTPFVCWYFRMLGAKIGPRVYMETTDMTEFDLVTIGREATLNADCTIQTHLFEDRVMKMSTIEIAPQCVVGSAAFVLYDTRMEEGALLSDMSLLMKGETLPAWTRWEGIPARPAPP